jgi:hypothetical protein
MTDVTRLRPDWGIARGLNKDGGLIAAQNWMRSPLVDLREVDLLAREDKPSHFRNDRSWLEYAPWPDAVYLMRLNVPAPFGGAVLTEVASRVVIPKLYRPSSNGLEFVYGVVDPAKLLKETLPKDPDFVLSSYGRAQGGDWEWIHTSHGGTDNFAEYLSGKQDWQEKHGKEAVHTCFTGIIYAVGYLTECPEYMVEVRPEPKVRTEKQKRKLGKTVQRFPWLNEEAPRLILLDPSKQYPRYGRGVGTHASPVPHQRRGHWMTLRAERYKEKKGHSVWRKPAWIGDQEWVFKGSVYRVVDLPANQPEA